MCPLHEGFSKTINIGNMSNKCKFYLLCTGNFKFLSCYQYFAENVICKMSYK